MNDKPTENLPARPEAEAILNEARNDAGFEKMLKFKRGNYTCEGEEVPLGTRMVAHCVGWAKAWIKFRDKQLVERKVYRVSRRERVPAREELDERDERQWPRGPDGRQQDPWVLQFLLPMEAIDTDEVMVFVTASFGGRRAVAELCTAYGRRAQRDKDCGQPEIRLQTVQMPTSNFGNVPRPHFDIIGWRDGSVGVREVSDAPVGGGGMAEEMNDEIPF